MTRYIVTLKWGDRYGPEYVNRLASAVRRHTRTPVTIVCFTDDGTGIDPSVEIFPIPEIDLPAADKVTGWRKICLFRPDLPIDGLGLFVDLDVVITGSLDDFFTFGNEDDIPIIHNWMAFHKKFFIKDPMIGNSSVFRWKLNHCAFVWDQFHKEKEWALANFRPPQSYLTHCIRPRMKFWPAEWVRSFKRHCRHAFPLNWLLAPSLPASAKIIAFHGKPDPDEAAVGYRGKRLNHYSRPAPWIDKNWC
ncbi:MAG: glycosyl transferase [Luteolibacter sp.]|uniref:glycosyl transferase n=1 Tax=Luteolibacter sp. TaxID=1962973 RepID=UPI0032679A18